VLVGGLGFGVGVTVGGARVGSGIAVQVGRGIDVGARVEEGRGGGRVSVGTGGSGKHARRKRNAPANRRREMKKIAIGFRLGDRLRFAGFVPNSRTLAHLIHISS